MKQENKDKHLAKRSGFTLIEVILVVVIIGILGGVFMSKLNIGGQTERAKLAAAKSNIVALANGLEMYMMKNDKYPSTLQELTDKSDGDPVMHSIPDDPWGNPYNYTCPGSHRSDYDLSASGHEDDVNNWD